eukprot:9411189-Pyramimonas_sp.AAC.1
MCATPGRGPPRVPGGPRALGTPGARACQARLVRQMPPPAAPGAPRLGHVQSVSGAPAHVTARLGNH